jgi:hypothetical protein
MRYIKSYKIFESEKVNDMLQTIKDILLPISDMGYNPSVVDNTVDWSLGLHHSFVKDPTELIIRIVTYTDDPLEITSEVIDEFNRLNDYLESFGYNMCVKYVKSPINNILDKWGGQQLEDTYNDFIYSINVVRNLLFVAKKESEG